METEPTPEGVFELYGPYIYDGTGADVLELGDVCMCPGQSAPARRTAAATTILSGEVAMSSTEHDDGAEFWLAPGIGGHSIEVSDHYHDDWYWSCKGDTADCAADLASVVNEYITGVQARAHEGTVIITPEHQCPPCQPAVSSWVVMASIAVAMFGGWVVGRRSR